MSWDQVQMVILGVTPEHGIGWSKQQSGFDNKIHVRTGQEKNRAAEAYIILHGKGSAKKWRTKVNGW